MYRLSIYFLRRFIPWLIIAICAIVLIFLTTQLIRVAPVFLGAGAGPWDTGKGIALLLIPVITWSLTPAFILAAFGVAGRMVQNGERVALDASGIGPKPAIIGSSGLLVVLTSLSGWLWLAASPGSQTTLRQMAARFAGNALTQRFEPGVFLQPHDGITFYADQKNSNKFEGVFLEDARDGARPVQLVATSGVVLFQPQSTTVVIRLVEGTAFLEPGPTPTPGSALSFDALELKFSLAETVERRLEFLPAVRAAPTAHLLTSSAAGISARTQAFALWRRVAGPAGFALMAALSIYLAFGHRWRRRQLAIAAACGVFAAFHLFGRMCESLWEREYLSGPQAALAPVIAVCGLIALGGLYRIVRIKTGKIVQRSQI